MVGAGSEVHVAINGQQGYHGDGNVLCLHSINVNTLAVTCTLVLKMLPWKETG